ncbi:FtsX-like permease family protein [Maribacter cobaltidurans]|uniref:Uncharacterized protein n=1 Tax=Maribacter cobaltidurans TaxID=1178778 RepID=A0A223V560_9FLAO|nr:FtsX-like permease family protein [Maribacter cobaltidurans]ASV30554.1 hypothetical protein CJ263_10215 [Maribacter cobaltidurans]GGD79735.1 ABC transporter permease [Maribacter cobaltidurans]
MLRNHFKIAWRNIFKNKVFSFINVIGLSIGICAAMVIGAIVYYDFSFDTFHLDKERIYRVVSVFETKEGTFSNRGVPIPLMRTFKEGVSGVEVAAPFFNTSFHKVENQEDDLKFKNAEDALFAGDNYFNVFHYEWLVGDKKTALSQPAQVVLEQKRAKKYFPHTKLAEIVGRTLMYNDSIPVKVTGVVAGFTNNTDFNFYEFMSLPSAKLFGESDMATDEEWNSTSSGNQLFFKVNGEGAMDNVQARLDALAEEHKSTEPWAADEKRLFALQPLEDLHFGGKYNNYPFNNSEHSGDLKVLKALGFVALFLLLLGCANFINLSSAQALTRAKEIGIQKTLGSSKRQLIVQFLCETFLLTIVAALLSALLAPLLLKQFTDFLPSGIDLDVLYSPWGLASILLLVATVSLLSGFYPAFVLSKFRPVLVLKGQMVKGNKGTRLRKTLTVFQFAVAQVFIIATVLVGKQLYYAMNKDMGIKTHALAFVHLPWNGNTDTKTQSFFDRVKNINGLSNVSLGGNPPASNNVQSTILTYYKDGKETHQGTEMLKGDLTYLDTYGIPLLSGRERLNDSIKEFVVNEAFAKGLGFQDPSQVVGSIVKLDTTNIPVVGLIRDFNQRSLRSSIKPLAIYGQWNKNSWSRYTTLHFDLGPDSKSWQDAIKEVENAWATVYPDEEITVNFMDDTVKGFYNKERHTAQLLKWAAGLAILISCLGLFGLVIYTTERRTKEIGVRKVLGANLLQLNLLLSKEFMVLVFIGFAIAAPLGWWGVNNWLQDYAYKTTLSWWVFAASGLGMVIVALIIIGLRIFRTANINPVESLRTE